MRKELKIAQKLVLVYRCSVQEVKMSLLTYDYEKEKQSLDTFANRATARFLEKNVDVECLGPLTNTPGMLFEISNVYETSDQEMQHMKDVFYDLGAKRVVMEINSMTQTVYFSVEKPSVAKRRLFSGSYKCIPPLPIIFCLVLCLYKYQNGTLPLLS